MVDPCAFMVDPSCAFSADGPTKLMGLLPLVDALLLSNPKPILQLGKEDGKLLVDLVLNGPFQYGSMVEPRNETTLAMIRARTYTDLTDEEKISESVYIKATNIVLQELDSGLVVPSFNPSNDQITNLNKLMAFATIQDGRVTVQTVQRRQTQGYANNRARNTATNQGCTKPKRPKNSAWFKEKLLLCEALESRAYLDPKQLAFLADYGDSVIQT
ncbi:hypothetical protein Tco_1343284 [Tanacetum coccineum]